METKEQLQDKEFECNERDVFLSKDVKHHMDLLVDAIHKRLGVGAYGVISDIEETFGDTFLK